MQVLLQNVAEGVQIHTLHHMLSCIQFILSKLRAWVPDPAI